MTQTKNLVTIEELRRRPEYRSLVKGDVAGHIRKANANGITNLYIHDVNILDEDLTGVDLTGALISNVWFTRTRLQDAKFVGAELRNVSFIDLWARFAHFEDAMFNWVAFNKVELDASRFDNTRLQNTEFNACSLADIGGVYFFLGGSLPHRLNYAYQRDGAVWLRCGCWHGQPANFVDKIDRLRGRGKLDELGYNEMKNGLMNALAFFELS